MHTHRVPLYGNVILFTRSRKEFAKEAARFDEHISEDEASDGLTLTYGEGAGFLVGVFTKDPGTLAHEMGHVALSIIERASFDAHSGNQEPFCYLLGHLVNHFSKVR